MSDEINFSFNIDPNFHRSLTGEQRATLEKIERLGELDPEITARLARALDRLQRTQPYQQLRRPTVQTATKEPEPPRAEMSEAERAAREDFITQELSALLAIAGQLAQVFEAERPRAQAERRFKDQLRSQFK